MNLKGLLTCPPVPNMKVILRMVPKIEPMKDLPWTSRSRSLKINGLVGLANLCPCAKFERRRSNGSSDITYQGLTVTIWPWPIWARSPQINTVLGLGIAGQCAKTSVGQTVLYLLSTQEIWTHWLTDCHLLEISLLRMKSTQDLNNNSKIRYITKLHH